LCLLSKYREHDKKVAALGLTSLLLVPENMLPPDLQSGMGQVVKGLLRVLAAYKEQRDGELKVCLTLSASMIRYRNIKAHALSEQAFQRIGERPGWSSREVCTGAKTPCILNTPSADE
jgi:hypothetical protein